MPDQSVDDIMKGFAAHFSTTINPDILRDSVRTAAGNLEKDLSEKRPWYKRAWDGVCKAARAIFGFCIATPSVIVGGTLALAGVAIGTIPVVGVVALPLIAAAFVVAAAGVGVTWLLCLPFGGFGFMAAFEQFTEMFEDLGNPDPAPAGAM